MNRRVCFLALITILTTVLSLSAKEVYTITGDVSDPIDLTSLDDCYADRIKVEAAGDVTVSGLITAGGVTVQNPFQLIRASGKTVLKSSTGIGRLPLKTVGAGRWQLNDVSPYVISKSNGNPYFELDAGTRIDFGEKVQVFGDSTEPAVFVMGDGSTAGTGYFVFGNGGDCDVRANGGTLSCWGNLSLGNGTSSSLSKVNMTLLNATVDCGGVVYLSNGERAQSADEFAATAVSVEIGAGTTFYAKNFQNYGYARTRLKFTGGRFVARNANAALFSTYGENYSTSAIEIEGDGAPIDITLDADQPLTGGYGGSSSRPVNLVGDGGFVKRGAGTLTWNRHDSSSICTYTGDTVVEGGSIVLASDDFTAAGSDLRIAADATFDLAGHSAAFRSVSGAGTLVNTSGTPAVLTLSEGLFDIAVIGAVKIVKTGSGALEVRNEAFDGEVDVRGGTVKVASRAELGYPHYRFKVDAVAGSECYSMQLSEFKLLDGETDVTGLRTGFGCVTGRQSYYPEQGEYPPGESPDKAVDGDLGTKWDDYRGNYQRISQDGDSLWIRLDYAAPRHATAYAWATANDNGPNNGTKNRDPRDWRVQGSDDGVNWTDLDVRTGMGPYADRKTWVGTFDLTYPRTKVSWSRLTLGKGTTLDVRGVDFSCASFGNDGGSVVSSEGDDFILDVETSMELVNPGLELDGNLVKAGPGTVTLIGENDIRGTVKVSDGTLACRPFSYAGKYYRVSVYANRDNLNILQISEFSLFDTDGMRINQGSYTRLGDTVPAAQLKPCEVSVCQSVTQANDQRADKLFDGDTGTKWCTQYKTPSAESPLQFVFRLPDDAKPAAGYNFTSGNDTAGARDPVTWSIEGSANGTDWVLLDEKANAETPHENKAEFNDGVPYRFASLTDAEESPFGSAALTEVAAGATLDFASSRQRLSALCVDCAAGAGTITRFTPAANGRLVLENADGLGDLVGYELPVTVGEIGDTSALRTWKVSVGGVEEDSLRVCWRNGKLMLKGCGLLLQLK